MVPYNIAVIKSFACISVGGTNYSHYYYITTHPSARMNVGLTAVTAVQSSNHDISRQVPE